MLRYQCLNVCGIWPCKDPQGSSPSVSLPPLYCREGLAMVTNSSALEGRATQVAIHTKRRHLVHR